MATPNMGLELPSPLVTPGPTWAQLLNDALDVIDAHDHTSGNGAQITTAALNIDGNLDFAGYALENLGRASLVNLGAASTSPRSVYSFGGELYYTDASGNAVQLTIGGSPAGGGGTIDGLISPASAFYNSGAQGFEWSVNAVLRADLDFGRAIFRQASAASGAAITLGAPTTGVSAYSITLPPTAPVGGSTRLVSAPAGSSAALAWIGLDGTSIEISGSTLQVRPAGITTAKIADANVTTAKLADESVTTAKIAAVNVTTAKIADLNVTTAKIADANVTTSKIADANVTTAKVADSAITNAKLATGSVDGRVIADGSIGSSELATGSVTTSKLADVSVTTIKIAAQAVTPAEIQPAAVITSKLADGAVTTAKIADLNVTTAKIADLNVTTAKIADLNVTTAKIADLGVTTGKIANSAVTGAKIAGLTIGNGNIATDAIDSRTIVSGGVGTSQLASLAVTSSKIGDIAVMPRSLNDNYYLGATAGGYLGAAGNLSFRASWFDNFVVSADNAGLYNIGWASTDNTTGEIACRLTTGLNQVINFQVWIEVFRGATQVARNVHNYSVASGGVTSVSLIPYLPFTYASQWCVPVFLSAGTYTMSLYLYKPNGVEAYVNNARLYAWIP